MFSRITLILAAALVCMVTLSGVVLSSGDGESSKPDSIALLEAALKEGESGNCSTTTYSKR